MKGKEIAAEVREQKTPSQHFIKWWRKENDFVDFELIDRFLEGVEPEIEFAGYELLDMEQMWSQLKQACPDKVERDEQWRKEVVVWKRPKPDSAEKSQVFPFDAQSLMTIFDFETKGNVID